jgi:hypothetical protein
MDDKKKKFVDYLNENASRYGSVFVHPGIKAVLSGDFSNLPEYPSDDDWRVLALMVDGYALSEQLGMGELGDYLTKLCLPEYDETGALPDKSIKLWIFLYGMQRREHWIGRPLEGKEKDAVLDIYSKLRQNLQTTKGVDEMIKSLEVNAFERFRKILIHRYWQYQEEKYPQNEKYFDRPNNNFQRPPVFLQSEARNNILAHPGTASHENEQLYGLIKVGEHHKWFRSMNSSQALAVSVLGNLFVHGKLSILAQLKDDDGLPLLGSNNISFDNFSMEHKINYLGEPRRTSVDAFISGAYQVAIECKFTEFEVGSCSRPRLIKTASNYQMQYCNGAYMRQRGRKERCTLTEIGVKYWEYIPYFFHWDKDRDFAACPLRNNYQLVRNILEAGINENGSIYPINGQVIMVYDRRNPACQHGGKIFKSYHQVKKALIYPGMLRKITWQNIISYMRRRGFFPC